MQKERDFEVIVENDVFVIGDKAFCVYDGSEKRPKAYRRVKYLSYLAREIQLFQLCDVNGFTMNNFIKAKLGFLSKTYARNTKIQEIDQMIFSSILDSYHIQGATKSTHRFGLFENDKPVAAIGFIRQQEFFNLNRLVFTDTAVIGGASKLLKHFRKLHSDSPIVTFSNNGYSDGGIYEKLGFRLVNEEPTDMWYISKSGELLNRRGFQKKFLSTHLPIFDPGKTEVQNMTDNGFGVYYGPGTKRWELA